jgi:hypothetical protein
MKLNKMHIMTVARRLGVQLTPQEAQDMLDEVLPNAKEMHRDKDMMNKVVDKLTEKLNEQRGERYGILPKKE